MKIGEVYCISCPTANGMSGSPVLVKTGIRLEVIGLIHGGPAGFIHRRVSGIINKFKDNCVGTLLEKFLMWLQDFRTQRLANGLYCPIIIKPAISCLKIMIKTQRSGKKLIMEEFQMLRDWYSGCLVAEAAMGSNLNYNLGIPAISFYRDILETLARY